MDIFWNHTFQREGVHLAANGDVCDWSDLPIGAIRD